MPAVTRCLTRVTRCLTGIVAVTLLLAAGGCGVPLDDHPRDGDDPRRPYRAGAPRDGGGTAIERLCFIRDTRLVRTERKLPLAPTAQQQLDDLLTGPTAEESTDGITSALPGTAPTAILTLTAGRAVVEVGDRSDHGVRSDEVLAFGQLVCTLTSRPEVGTITFTSQGMPLGVPRANGSLTNGPLTIADYATLIEG